MRLSQTPIYYIIKSQIDTIFQYEDINHKTEDNFELIIQYYNTLSENEQEFFRDIITNYSLKDLIQDIDNLSINGNSFLCFKIISYLGLVKEFINSQMGNKSLYGLLNYYDSILSLLNDDDSSVYGNKLIIILDNLNPIFYPFGVSISDQDKFKGKIQGIKINIIEWKIGKIKIKVNQIDVEINSDQNKVIELIEEFGLSPEFNKFLTGLKQKDISDEDEIQFAGTIATYREFFGQIIIEIANKIAELNKENIHQYQSGDGKDLGEIANSRKYIKEKIGLSSKDNKFIDGYVDILHKEGGHNMFSNKDYFRLTKNIGIEILYMLLSKTKEFNQ